MKRKALCLFLAALLILPGLFIPSHHNHFLNACVGDAEVALASEIAEDAFSVVAARHPDLGLFLFIFLLTPSRKSDMLKPNFNKEVLYYEKK